MSQRLIACEERETWLSRVADVIEDLAEGLKSVGYEVKVEDGIVYASNGDCELEARVSEGDPTAMIESLGKLSETAVRRGWGVVWVEILVTEGCHKLCKEAVYSLMKGGG